MTPSDQLARLIDAARLALGEQHYRANILEDRRARRIMRGRSAARRAGRRVRPWECI